MKPTRWSYSSLSTYETCPSKWKYRYIDGLPDPPSPAMERGTRLHSQCEEYLNGGVEAPGELGKIAHILERLRANTAKAECAWRLDAEWNPIEHGGRVIGIVDVHFRLGDALHIYDFKTGRTYPGHAQQLELYALLGASHHPDVDRFEVGAIYIDTGKLSRRRTITRDELSPIRADWHQRAEAMLADEVYEPNPKGGGCYWCPYKSLTGGPCTAWKKSGA